MSFQNRRDAGQKLSQALLRYRDEEPVIVGLARGGIPIAYEIAQALNAPLDVLVARKIGAPFNPELGVGAIAPNHILLLNEALVRQLGVSEEYLSKTLEQEYRILAERMERYHQGQPDLNLTGKTVILVDDGLATGITARAAIQSIEKKNPKKIILAVPVCSQETAVSIRKMVHSLICLESPADFMAVGLWYQEFNQTDDLEVLTLLDRQRNTLGSQKYDQA